MAIEFAKGDLVDLAKKGNFDVIVHGCNCFCTMNSGVAKAIKEAYPRAYDTDLCTINGSKDKLGLYSISIKGMRSREEPDIVNAYTQFDYGRDGKDRFEYSGFRYICKGLADRYKPLRLGMPKIGSGLAGGDWSLILQIIVEELSELDVTIVEFSNQALKGE